MTTPNHVHTSHKVEWHTRRAIDSKRLTEYIPNMDGWMVWNIIRIIIMQVQSVVQFNFLKHISSPTPFSYLETRFGAIIILDHSLLAAVASSFKQCNG